MFRTTANTWNSLIAGWWFGHVWNLEHDFSIQLGISSSHLTKSDFSEG
jgi:type 1 glutamine amidotransferase